MKTVYEASNAIEAHMIQDLLKQEGIAANIQGENLMGAIGELPAAGLVRVVASETDYAHARAVVERWDAAQPREDVAPTRTAQPSRLLSGLLFGLIIGIAGSYAFFRAPVSVEGVDHNRDSILDEKWTFAPSGARLKFEADRNLDGRIDLIARFNRDDLIETEEGDDNFDGIYETIHRYRHSLAYTSEIDTNGDGYRDLISRYNYGVLTSVEFMHPTTFRPLRVEHYQLGLLTSAEVDSDKDGKLDIRRTYDALGDILSSEPLLQ